MDANQNPPNEREVIIDFSKVPKQPPIAWSTGAWNGPIIELDPNDPFGHMESLFSSGIHVIAITPPEVGWPIALHCPICNETTFVLSPWAIKPSDGGYFRMNDVCGNEELSTAHNMALAVEQLRKDRKIEIKVHTPLPYFPFPSMAQFTQMMPIEEAKKRWPNTPIPREGEENGKS